MKKVFLTLATIAAFGTLATASVAFQTEKQVNKTATAVAPKVELPQAVKTAVDKEFPGCSVKEVLFNQVDKTYAIKIVKKGETKETPLTYKATGEKVEVKAATQATQAPQAKTEANNAEVKK